MFTSTASGGRTPTRLTQVTWKTMEVAVVVNWNQNYYCYVCLTAFFQDNLGKPAPVR